MSQPEAPASPQLDYESLQSRLGLRPAPSSTGFWEERFDACDLGDALHTLEPPLVDCHRAYFTLIHFQLSCREDVETQEILTESDLQPVKNRRLSYALGRIQGASLTNARGEGVIRAIHGASLRRAHLRISTGKDFLMVRANEVTAIVTPPQWCQ